MRQNKKDYFNKQLEQHRNDTQGTWKVLNSKLENSSEKSGFPENMNINNQSINTETTEAVNGFNEYFVNVGYNLAKDIIDPLLKDDINENIIEINPNNIFLKRISETEVINVVNKFKMKTSVDCIDLDMKLV